MTASILIVDDDPDIRTSLSQALAAVPVDVRTADSAEQALAAVAQERPDMILADVRMPGMSGLDMLRLLNERAPGIDVVLMTAFDDLATVSAGMRGGAVDFLVKPLDLHQLRRVVAVMLEDRRARAGRSVGAPAAGSAGAAGDAGVSVATQTATAAELPILVGRDARMIQIYKLIGQVAASRASVIIRGESGTGKELIAQAIHRASPAAGEPFVAINCTSMPSTLLESELFGHVRGSFTGAVTDRRGRFALAGRGTLFLDEIGDTTTEFQAKLLRVLQEREYYPVGAERPETAAARVIAATHRDLEAMVAAGAFRADLYYRLRVIEITLPPLRERVADIPLLAEHLIRRASEAAARTAPLLSSDALDALLRHGWPGNVRELENALTRAVLLAAGDVIRPEHLALDGRVASGGDPGLVSMDALEGWHVQRVLDATGWHKVRAAAMLGVSRPRLDRLIEKHRLGTVELPQ